MRLGNAHLSPREQLDKHLTATDIGMNMRHGCTGMIAGNRLEAHTADMSAPHLNGKT
jgi:hypothetical protein